MNVHEQRERISIEPLEDEAHRWPHRPMAIEGEMDITPMIDMTFLLLIFFLVGTRMDTQASVQLPEARHGTGVATNSAVILTIARGEGERARVYQGDGMAAANQFSATDVADQQRQIAAYVQEQLNAAVPKQHVLIKAERHVKHQEVARVAKAVSMTADVPLYVGVFEVQ